MSSSKLVFRSVMMSKPDAPLSFSEPETAWIEDGELKSEPPDLAERITGLMETYPNAPSPKDGDKYLEHVLALFNDGHTVVSMKT